MALGHLDELQKAEIVSKSKLLPSVFQVIHFILEVVVTDRFHCGKRFCQPLDTAHTG